MAVIKLNHIIQSIHGKAGNVVFVYRNGTQFIRPHVVPHDPKTRLQIENRKIFARSVSSWQKLPQCFKDSWNRYGKFNNRTGYNLFISETMRALKQGKHPELVKVKYLSRNESSMLMTLRKCYNEVLLHQAVCPVDYCFQKFENSFLGRDVIFLQRE